jgi:cytosine/adenosine deaminase-related metal-dependent hydrolase
VGDGDNNLVVLDYDSPTEMNPGNFYGHFLFGLNSNHVSHVISNGRLIVSDRKMTTVNEQEILKTSRGLANKLWVKMQE